MTELSTPVSPILPGAWLGMIGGGQLGRMFCFAAQTMGYRIAVLDPDPTSPAGTVADWHLCAAYDDGAALTQLARRCAAISIEFENVPTASLDFLAHTTFVAPAGRCVAIAQDRIAEKRFIASTGAAVAPYIVIESAPKLAEITDEALETVLPGILKTARLGYDGKGQMRVHTVREVRDAYAALGDVTCVLEKRLALRHEISVLIARGVNGQSAVFPVALNVHRQGILALTLAPAPVDGGYAKKAQQIAARLADALDYIGVLCVEFFILENGSLIVNEMAPRPHNSGHYTVDACMTSQFQQQVRAMTRMPLGNPRPHSSAAMLNILGDIWFTHSPESKPSTPPWDQVAAISTAKLHLYGKEEARAGRKMGHVNFIASTLRDAREDARACARLLHISLELDKRRDDYSYD